MCEISPRDAMVTMKRIFADCQNVLVQRSPLAMDARARWGKEEPILGEQADLLGHLSGINSRKVPLDANVLELLPDILIDQGIQVLNVPVRSGDGSFKLSLYSSRWSFSSLIRPRP